MRIDRVTLVQYAAYIESVAKYDDELTDDLSENRRKIIQTRIIARKAFDLCKFFDIEIAGAQDAIAQYNDFHAQFESLKPLEINPDEVIFGQFYDIRLISSGITDRWKLLPYIIAIFDTNGEPYDPNCTREDHLKFVHACETKLHLAIRWMLGYDAFNKKLAETYFIFQESGEATSEHMSKYAEQWGWIDFMVGIASKKIFDLPGYNSIDSAQKAPLTEVLTLASMEKAKAIAMNADMEERMSKK